MYLTPEKPFHLLVYTLTTMEKSARMSSLEQVAQLKGSFGIRFPVNLCFSCVPRHVVICLSYFLYIHTPLSTYPFPPRPLSSVMPSSPSFSPPSSSARNQVTQTASGACHGRLPERPSLLVVGTRPSRSGTRITQETGPVSTLSNRYVSLYFFLSLYISLWCLFFLHLASRSGVYIHIYIYFFFSFFLTRLPPSLLSIPLLLNPTHLIHRFIHEQCAPCPGPLTASSLPRVVSTDR